MTDVYHACIRCNACYRIFVVVSENYTPDMNTVILINGCFWGSSISLFDRKV